jgi:hypothetical protein
MGLIPINLHLQKLVAQSSYQITTLSSTHPLAALRQRAGSKKVPQHWHSLSRLDYNTCLQVHSSFAKAVHACHLLNEPFDADADEARLGHHVMDLFSWRIHFEESESKEDVDQAEFLEWQFDLADAVPSCILVATNASVPTKGKWQAALAAWLWHGSKFLQRTRHATGRVTAPDTELYTIWIGLGLATAVPGAKSIKLFTDHFAVVRKAVDPSIHAGQGHSLEVCRMLADWLGLTPRDQLLSSKSSHALSGASTKMSMTTSWISILGLVWGSIPILPSTMLASMPLMPARTSGLGFSTPVLSTVVEAFCTSTIVEVRNSSPPM